MDFWQTSTGKTISSYSTVIKIVVGTILVLLTTIAIGVWRKK